MVRMRVVEWLLLPEIILVVETMFETLVEWRYEV